MEVIRPVEAVRKRLIVADGCVAVSSCANLSSVEVSSVRGGGLPRRFL